ncbi:MAG TPA: YsnF/AvaK domain-containing protein [Bryobacteraceae bacterium]
MSASDKEAGNEIVIPVVRDEVKVDAVPVETGGVRVTKRPRTREETVEQELLRRRVEVKRVKLNRPVDEPPPVRREGDTTIVPVLAEVLKIQKQLVVTEEIHISEVEERETVRQNVTLNSEEVRIERFDETGDPVSAANPMPARRRRAPRSLIKGAPHRS